MPASKILEQIEPSIFQSTRDARSLVAANHCCVVLPFSSDACHWKSKMNTLTQSPTVQRRSLSRSVHRFIVLCQAAGSVDRLACPGTAAPRPFAIINPPIDPSPPLHPAPPPPRPTGVGWCGFLTDRSSYRYQSTHSPAAGHYPDPSFDPGTVSTRRVLSRAVQSYQKFDAAPHPAPCYPRLSQPIPTPGQALVERVSDRS